MRRKEMKEQQRLAITGPVIAVFALCLLLSHIAPAGASVIVERLDFPSPVVTNQDNTSLVAIEGIAAIGNPGEPLLPAHGLQVLLPQGEEVVAVNVSASGEEEIRLDLPIEWAQAQVPLSMRSSGARTIRDDGIYMGDVPFPARRAVHVTTEIYRGYSIAFIRVYPVTYIGASRTIVFARRLEVTVETAPDPAALSRSRRTLRVGTDDRAAVARVVGDVSAAASYVRPEGRFRTLSSLVDPEDTYPYVIITHNTFFPAFEPLKEHRENRGLRTKIVAAGQIAGQYSGQDQPEKIRNFIIDAYQNWGTEYVLLAGDESVIPHRGLYATVGDYVDEDIASDLYYAALDGNWNDDEDGLWGESDEADLMPEVCVGRASVSDSAEAANFVSKVLKYENSPVVSQIDVAQMVGELLWSDPTWGGDYKDEIKDGSSAHGYTTVGFPPAYTVHTLYDRDLNPLEWDKEDLIPLLNGGRHLVNHMGHSSNTYGLRMYNSDVTTRFTNDGVSNSYLIIYTQGCYSGAFDNRTASGAYIDDCLGEYFTSIENGAVAYIGNTRYGWGAHASTQGGSQYYDRQFFDALFGEGLTAIGKANDDSKIDNIVNINIGSLRWVYYELVLLGDPAMDIWTDTPGYLTLIHPDVIHVSDNEISMTVTDGIDPVEGARVGVFSDTTYSFGYTDASGVVYLDPVALEPGSLQVAVTAHNFYSHLDTIAVTTATHPLVIVEDFTIDDDMSGGSSGNSNAGVDAGETIESAVLLKNVGQDSAFSVSAELSTTDPYVVVIDSSGSYGDIAPDSTISPGWSYRYQVSESAPDSHLVAFDLEIVHLDSTATRHLNIPISAPNLAITGITVADTLYGNGDGCVETGETFELTLTLTNMGSGDGEGVTVFLTESDPYVVIEDDSAYIALIVSGGEGEPLPPFVIELTPDCPKFHRIDLNLDIQFASGRHAAESTAVYVGGTLEEDYESGIGGWTHADLGDGGIDNWHLEDYRNHTPAGVYSFKFGGEDSLQYSNYSHGRLMTPALCLGSNATLTFWHWIQAELQGGGYSWDGAIVEISTDGGETWTQITPVGGYPYLISLNSSFPFEPGTPCFAWTNVWTEVVFDLSAYEGSARIGFSFGSDGSVVREGWYVDDITITDDLASIDIDDDDLEVMPTTFALHGVSPNPMSSRGIIMFDVPRSSRVSIELFDVTGRSVDTLADSVFEPGRYSRTVDYGASLAPGVYFLSMRSAGFAATNKVIVLR
ncbi:MAG: C25 family cysteine peptidase [Candidatus Eisenbacteria bacterium]